MSSENLRIKIKAENLDVYYGATRALKNVTIECFDKRVTAIIGPSGCGKSTFIRTLNRMNDVIPGTRLEGKILIDGADIHVPEVDVVDLWRLRHVTFPLLAPLIIPAIIIRGIFAFNQFYLIQLFGFYHVNFSMTTLATLSYNFFNPSGFFGANGQFAVSAAMNIITLLILIGFVTMFNRLSKADEGVTYA